MRWLKSALGIGGAAIPAVSAAQAVARALDTVANTDDEKRAVETLRPKLAHPTGAAAQQVVAALAQTHLPARGWWASSWRPALGWACTIILLWHYVGRDLISIVVDLPPAQGELVTVMITVLGNSMLRSIEKAGGVSR